MIRVLHIVGDMDLGGLETMIMNIYRNINRDEIQFDFLEYGDKDMKYYYDDEIKSLGGKIYRLSDHNINFLNRIKQHKKFFESHPEYQIIHNHLSGVTGMCLGINILARNKKIKKIISHSHTNKPENNRIKTKIKHNILKVLNNIYSTDYLACSKEAAEFMFSKNIAENKVFYLYNPIDVKKYVFNNKKREQLRKQLNIENDFVVGHVGRFDDVKNHEFLIKIFNEILKLKPNSKLVLCGIGDLQEKIKKQIEILKIKDKVLFLGARNDIYNIMQAFDVFVFPSKFEGLGIVAIEAQAAALPVIASENVPIEIDITPVATHISLNKSEKYWAEETIKIFENYDRNISNVNLLETEYDIDILINKLMDFYKIGSEK